MPFVGSILVLAVMMIMAGCSGFGGGMVGRSAHQADDLGHLRTAVSLSRGTKLAVVPFTAGAGVVANDELEKVSLVMVKGIIDTINADGAMEVVDPQDAHSAEYVIDGHITDIGQAQGGILPWPMKSRQSYLAVEVFMREAKTGNTVMQFVKREDASDGHTDVQQLALNLGRELAQWLTEKVE